MSQKEQKARMRRLSSSKPLQPYAAEWLTRDNEPLDMSPESRAVIERMIASLG